VKPTTSTIIKYVVADLIALGIALFVGFVASFSIVGLKETPTDDQKAGLFLLTYGLVPLAYAGLFVFFAYWLFKIRQPAKYRLHYVVVMLATLVLALVAQVALGSWNDNKSRLSHVTGQESRELFDQNDHKYHVLPESAGFSLESRAYAKALTKTLESVYVDALTNTYVEVTEGNTGDLSSYSCSDYSYPCREVKSDLGTLRCLDKELDMVTCQFSPDEGYVVSVTGRPSVQRAVDIVERLTALPTQDIRLTQ
jgi:hypothetical protein